MPLAQMQLLTITQGMYFSRVLQINTVGNPPTPATGVFTASYTLSASVWIGQNQTALFAPTVSWWTNDNTQTGYTQGQVLFVCNGTNTVALDPAGEYYATVYATDPSGNKIAVVEVRVKILASPGTTSPTPPDLITYDYAEAAFSGNHLTDSQRDFLPYAIAAASKRWRRWCADRDFNQQTYTDVFPVALNGYVRLPQIPVNQVIRVQGQLDTAITISNNSSSVQTSQVLAAYTGDIESGQFITGLTLNWQSNGVANTQTILYSALSPPTIQSLATAINAVGSGWSALASSPYQNWPVTELYNVMIAVGTGADVTGDSILQVFSLDMAESKFHPDDGAKTGMLWVGRMSQGIDMRWGPDPIFYDLGVYGSPNLCKITYNAGFATIPSIVQFATAELVRVMMHGLKINPYIGDYKIGEVSFKLASESLNEIPKAIMAEMSQYRLHHA
jgi:hypothetical protein